MQVEDKIIKAAEMLHEASTTGKTCPPVREIIDEFDLDAAYQIQKYLTTKRLESGAKIVGVKIGLTSEAVQKQLGVDAPDYGMLFDDMQIENGGQISTDELMQPKAEGELAFVLNRDINASMSDEALKAAIDYACVAIEIVGSRIKDWDIRIADTIADNASASHFILSNEKMKVEEIDLVNCKMTMYKNGEIASEGHGADCMGSPLKSTQWLIDVMISLGRQLAKGDIILSGACGPMTSVESGDKLKVVFEGIGQAECSFE